MYQIIKEDLKTRQRILLIDSHSEVLELETLREAEELVSIMNANASGFRYSYKKVGGVRNKNTIASVAEVRYVNSFLSRASDYGLQAEVVTYALAYMKQDHGLTIDQAITDAYNEWVK